MNDAAPLRALIVDDEPSVRQIIMRALNQNGFSCDAAADGRAALQMIKQTAFDVVITDLRMPDVNGHKLATELLSMPLRPAVIILTGVLEPKLSNDLWARGVDDIHYKPTDFALLAKKIRRAAEQRRQQTSSTKNGSAGPNTPLSQETSLPAVCERPETAPLASTDEPAKTIHLAGSHAINAANDSNARDLTRSMQRLEQMITAKQQPAVVRYVVVFVAGFITGSLLGWIGCAVMLAR